MTAQDGPAVSVVIPSFRGGPFLREAIASVQAQSLKDFELIVVDGGRIVADGPKDKVLEKLAAGNLRVASTGGPA